MKILSILTLILTAFVAFSQKIENKDLEKCAKVFYEVNFYSKCEDCILNQQDISVENVQLLKAFNFRDGGFVVFCNDFRFPAVFAYSKEGTFDLEKCSESERYWWKYIADGMNKAISQSDFIYKGKHESWNKLENGEFKINVTKNSYLLTTSWGQGCYYNSFCPEDSYGPCGHVVTGCVATAMAQIMKYWNYPEFGSGSHSYNHPVYGNLYVDFENTQYQWVLMEDQLFDENHAVAQLMYHCGVAMEMNYGPSESGSGVSTNAFDNYFLYSLNSELVFSYNYSSQDWKNLLRNQIDNAIPILYVGQSNLFPLLHAWVVDGYDLDDYFHFNWGWDSPGAFYLLEDNLFPQNHYAIINIFPSPDYDITVKEIISPTSQTFTEPSYIKVSISNYGMLPVSNIPVTYVVDNSYVVNEVINVTLERGETTVYEFNTPFDFSLNTSNSYDLKVYVNFSGDQYKINDTVYKTIINVPCAEIPFSSNEEENFYGWSIIDNNADGNKWIINNSNVLGVYNSNSNQANEWLFSRCLNLEQGKLYKLTFDYKTSGIFWQHILSVFLCSKPEIDFILQDLVFLYNVNNLEWNVAEAVFLVPETSTYNIGFHLTSEANMLSFAINNFEIKELNETDLMIENIINPISACDLENEEVIIQFRNYCSNILSNISLKYQINNGNIVEELFESQILPNEIVTYSFNTLADLSEYGDYYIKVWIDYPGDVNSENDTINTLVKNIASSTIPYFVGFENSDDYENWLIEDLNNDNKTWQYIQNMSFYCNSGNGCVRYIYNDFLPADDWLISKCVWLESGYIYKLSFFYRVESDYWPENFKVMLGTQQTNQAMNVLLGDFFGITNSVYQQSTLYFPIWEDNYYYFGFHCYSNAQMFNLYLDDIWIDLDGVNNINDKNSEFFIYPNPSSEWIRIYSNFNIFENIDIEVIDMLGHVWIKEKLKNTNYNINIDFLNTGTYFIRIHQANKIEYIKFIKI